MKQLSLAETGFLPNAGKTTRRAKFLADMEAVVPWSRLEGLIEPHYPRAGNGRPPKPLSAMLRIHFMQQWFGYSDPAMEEALHDIPLLRQFAGLDAFEDAMPDETTILNFRHLLEKHDLAVAIFAEVNGLLSEKGLTMRKGSIVDATLIAAPSSTKNEKRERDPDMSQTKKGNQWHFGMKAHIGVDAQSELVHTVECTTAKVADSVKLNDLLHGDEEIVLADRGYHKKSRTLDAYEPENGVAIVTPHKRAKGKVPTGEQGAENKILSSVRALVEHPFRVTKRQFGYSKVRYRGLAKNTAQIVTLFALSNLWMARLPLMRTAGAVRL